MCCRHQAGYSDELKVLGDEAHRLELFMLMDIAHSSAFNANTFVVLSRLRFEHQACCAGVQSLWNP